MKKVLFILASAFILFGCSSSKAREIAKNITAPTVEKSTLVENKNATTEQPIPTENVAGKTFVGAPSEEQSYAGCEGCGQRGSFEFSATDNKVKFIWSGSDIMDGGTYVQKGNKISISSMYGNSYTLTLSADYIELIDDKYKGLFRDTAYPWGE